MNYRIPKIEEFVEGFEFEILLQSGGNSYCIVNAEDIYGSIEEQLEKNRQPIIEEWKECVVPIITTPLLLEFVFPFSIKEFLNNNKIRTKNEFRQ